MAHAGDSSCFRGRAGVGSRFRGNDGALGVKGTERVALRLGASRRLDSRLRGNDGGLCGAQLVEDAAPIVLALRAVAPAADDHAVGADGRPRRLRANPVLRREVGLRLAEHPSEAVRGCVAAQRGGILRPRDGDDFDVVPIVGVEAAERAKLGAATRSPRCEEVEEDGPASGGFLYRRGRAVGEREGRVGRAVAGSRAEGNVGAPSVRRCRRGGIGLRRGCRRRLRRRSWGRRFRRSRGGGLRAARGQGESGACRRERSQDQAVWRVDAHRRRYASRFGRRARRGRR